MKEQAAHRPALSIVIPTLNEADGVADLIRSLAEQQGVKTEIIVADGGSQDNTAARASAAGARVIHSDRGRARQMNAGAAHACGEHLLFLHADSRIHDGQILFRSLEALDDAAKRLGNDRVAGHFRLRFDRRDSRKDLIYGYMEEKSALNRPQTANGDQGCLLSSRFFSELGGFDESLPFLEDQRLGARIRERGEWITLPGTIHTSARRFETEGFERRHILMAIAMGLYSTGYEEFFLRSGEIYRAQHETGILLMSPFFRLIRRIQRGKTLRERFLMWFRVGRYVRTNAWQFFFFCDVLLGRMFRRMETPFLDCYDRVFSKILNLVLVDLFSTCLTYLWVMGVLQGWFFLSERSWRIR